MTQIKENLEAVKSKIRKTAKKWDIDSSPVNIIAVSKKQPYEKIDAMLAAGHRIYGENRLQEALAHWQDRRSEYNNLELHLIGSLQTNKVKEAVSLFDVIHTIDRPKLAKAIKKEMDNQSRNIKCFIQVNTGEEEQKSGVLPNQLSDLLDYCKQEGLQISGLMCIPPFDESPVPHFALLKKMADEYGLEDLSMGMSGDFEKAIPLGANYIRVGTALFGARDNS